MCGIAGAVALNSFRIPDLSARLQAMNELQRHRGPDGCGIWANQTNSIGLAHRRLSIIDLENGAQPMGDRRGNCVTFNGEIYNYIEMKKQLWQQEFTTDSDTEAILQAYQKWGVDCVQHLRGMFAFALWNEKEQTLLCARDRFGIKPFYYAVVDNVLYFASEIKALLPFVPQVETDHEGLQDYLTFQLCLDGKTLFKGIRELSPGHVLIVKGGKIIVERYWEVHYDLDFDHTAKYFEEQLQSLLQESVDVHLRSDVPVGAYVSGGLDSSAIASLATDRRQPGAMVGFTGKFEQFGAEYDESRFARLVAEERGFDLHEVNITSADFVEHIRQVIYHLDFPVAGPGSFSQFMVSKLAAQHRKVVLGGQGGDEIFGGYTRYLIAYFEQCIQGAIDGTTDNGKFVVTYESIIPNLVALKQYKPMLKSFWSKGLFDPMDRRYFQLINRAPSLSGEIHWERLGDYQPFDTFRKIFHGENVKNASYFDLMTHFDFKTLLPGLLHVEDRMSMAHGLESRVPLLDHPLVELAATIPSNIKFENGAMKHIFKQAIKPHLPAEIFNRQDKMGFPTPLTQWLQTDIRDFMHDTLSSKATLNRDYVDNQRVLDGIATETQFGRKLWGLLCLELWQQQFHDMQHTFRFRANHDSRVDLSESKQSSLPCTAKEAA